MGEHLKAVEWIDRLPNGGGDWGKGIVGTVRKLEADVADGEAAKEGLDRQLQKLRDEVVGKKAEIDAANKGRRKLLKATVERAAEEAPMMFANVQIAQAKGAERAEDGGDAATA